MTPILNNQQVLEHLEKQQNPYFEKCYAFYSSWFGGIVTNPHLMLVPVDDHMVHRGDGIFEAMKSVNGVIYLLDQHLDRLMKSAAMISLKLPVDRDQLKPLIFDTLKAANRHDTMIRIFISRGPGGFSVNPYDSIASQLYIVIHDLKPPAAEKYEKGVVIGKSQIPVKSSWMAQVKSCNYLPNVLMKKEAVERHLDFVVGIDENGCLTESATENLLIVDKEGVIVYPKLDGILRGTTMMRTCELAREQGFKTLEKSFSIDDLLSAREVLITGTSLNVLPVVKFEDHLIQEGRPGAVARKLNELMLVDIEALS